MNKKNRSSLHWLRLLLVFALGFLAGAYAPHTAAAPINYVQRSLDKAVIVYSGGKTETVSTPGTGVQIIHKGNRNGTKSKQAQSPRRGR